MVFFLSNRMALIINMSAFWKYVSFRHKHPSLVWKKRWQKIWSVTYNCVSILDTTRALGGAVGISTGEFLLNVSVPENDSKSFILANTLPPKFTPRTKHSAAKIRWFWEQKVKRGKIADNDTVEKLGDGVLRNIFPRTQLNGSKRHLRADGNLRSIFCRVLARGSVVRRLSWPCTSVCIRQSSSDWWLISN